MTSFHQDLPIAWGNKLRAVDGSIKPYRAHPFDAGRDLFIQEDATIEPGKTAYLRAGICLDLKPGWAAFVMTRSSTFKSGLVVTPSIIDCGYTNEISTIVSNYGQEPINVSKGDRLAQLVLMPVFDFENEHEAINVGSSHREANDRFGSSGQNHEDMGV